ncbi:MAG: hypothetical protein K6E76_07315 [Patescibacteria group bacterium]|nr:hypothetical protein [Patescibacteria group bacterium]
MLFLYMECWTFILNKGEKMETHLSCNNPSSLSFDPSSFLASLSQQLDIKTKYTFRGLTIKEISKMEEFSIDEIYDKLPDNEKTFIYPRRAFDFYEAMEKGDIFI